MADKLKMVEKNGQMVPFYAADGKGKMKDGGMARYMGGGGIKVGYKYGGKVKKGYNYGGCVMDGRGGSLKANT